MFRSIVSYLEKLRSNLLRRIQSRKNRFGWERKNRFGWERKRNDLRRFLRKSLNVEGLEQRALMAVDANLTGNPFVIEMDAASNTGVDNMRDLIDSVQYAPVSARYKVYIIDEVHMLSKSAFNAILKTLEEPPPHVKFIFATTETRKIPVTIISRCQRFSLNHGYARICSARVMSSFESLMVAAGVSLNLS
jgi:DNA polymerase III subunit gamma/tau